MLADEELLALVRDLESDRVERKESLGGQAKDRAGQAVCAFANDLPGHGKPGVLMVGVDDEGRPTGLPITDQMLQELAALRSNGNILPLPNLVVEKRSIQGVDVAVVEVMPALDPPVRYYGQVWVRVGPTRAIATRDEERVLAERRRSADLAFDQRPARLASLDDLDLDLFRNVYLPAAVAPDILGQNRRTTEEQLSALHLLAPDGAPNHAALLLLGRDPRRWLPGAYVQFARFDGDELTSPIMDQKELDGSLPVLLSRAEDLAKLNIRIATQVANVSTEQRSPDYPLEAIQQVLRNAVLHRSYEDHAPVSWYWFDDRVEIHSPGGLFGRVHEQNFGQPYATDYRNPTLAEGLKVLGFVQRFGIGIALARRACKENGNPEPRFEFSLSSVLAVIARRA
jgi:ATP-dependent DNA helicase RecG